MKPQHKLLVDPKDEQVVQGDKCTCPSYLPLGCATSMWRCVTTYSVTHPGPPYQPGDEQRVPKLVALPPSAAAVHDVPSPMLIKTTSSYPGHLVPWHQDIWAALERLIQKKKNSAFTRKHNDTKAGGLEVSSKRAWRSLQPGFEGCSLLLPPPGDTGCRAAQQNVLPGMVLLPGGFVCPVRSTLCTSLLPPIPVILSQQISIVFLELQFSPLR